MMQPSQSLIQSRCRARAGRSGSQFHSHRQSRWSYLAILGLWLAVNPSVMATDPPLVDTIHLKSGGVLHGEAEEIVENKQNLYLVTTTDGTLLKLKRNQVARIEKPGPEMVEYASLAAKSPDTVDGHWQMQQWCLDNRLEREREYHLLRIVELDPDHKDARGRLGHRRINGIWVHWDHFMLNQGYVKDGRGVHRLPTALEMHERSEELDLVVKQWNKQLKNLISKIVRKNDAAALREFQAIDDPTAVPGLMKIYNEEGQSIELKKIIIDILGQIESSASQNALVVIATTTPDVNLDLAERAINLLKQPHFNRDQIVGTVVHWLSPKPTSSVQARLMVNRAAWLIGKMEYQGSIRPLIDALVTTHQVPTGAAGGNINIGQGPGGGGMQMGKQKQFVSRNFQNQAVLDTLRLLSPGGVDFDFDEAAWTEWYIQQNTPATYHVGRDQ